MISLFLVSTLAAANVPTEEQVCRDDLWVVIATVTELGDPFLAQESGSGPFRRIVDFRTEARAHGDLPPTFQIEVPSNLGPQGRTVYTSSAPPLALEGRYLLMGSRGYGRSQLGGPNRLVLAHHVKLDAATPPPPDALLASIWSEHCEPESVEARTLHPTQQFLQYIPEWALYWCEHYPPQRGEPRVGAAQ